MKDKTLEDYVNSFSMKQRQEINDNLFAVNLIDDDDKMIPYDLYKKVVGNLNVYENSDKKNVFIDYNCDPVEYAVKNNVDFVTLTNPFEGPFDSYSHIINYKDDDGKVKYMFEDDYARLQEKYSKAREKMQFTTFAPRGTEREIIMSLLGDIQGIESLFNCIYLNKENQKRLRKIFYSPSIQNTYGFETAKLSDFDEFLEKEAQKYENISNRTDLKLAKCKYNLSNKDYYGIIFTPTGFYSISPKTKRLISPENFKYRKYSKIE